MKIYEFVKFFSLSMPRYPNIACSFHQVLLLILNEHLTEVRADWTLGAQSLIIWSSSHTYTFKLTVICNLTNNRGKHIWYIMIILTLLLVTTTTPTYSSFSAGYIPPSIFSYRVTKQWQTYWHIYDRYLDVSLSQCLGVLNWFIQIVNLSWERHWSYNSARIRQGIYGII